VRQTITIALAGYCLNMPRPLALLVAAASLLASGCSSSEQNATFDASAGRAQPVATPPASIIVNGTPLPLARVTTSALEAAGAVALEEAVLDQLLDHELTRSGCPLPPDAAEQERRQLFARISADSGVGEEEAGLLIERFRTSRGLGPVRFASLLTRNAKLRALVRKLELVKASDVEEAVKAELGPKATARLIVTTTSTEAANLRTQVDAASPGERSVRFAQLAFEHSRDSSSPRGGLFGPVSHADPSVPASLRPFLSLAPGELSPIVAIDSGFAVLLIESQIPASPADPAVRAQALAKVTGRKEREAMDKLASELMLDAKVTVLDEPLRWSWERRPR
jgi:hypothetical protein